MRTVIYARVSTEDQAEKYGLPLQIRACQEYAKSHGLKVVGHPIKDEGVSGTTLDRPGLAKLRSLVAAGEVDVVLMYDTDRLSRELAHLLILKPEIERRAKLEFVLARFEDSPSGRMFFGIRGVIAQYEREQIRERTMRGKRERARSGLIVGGRTAYGYCYKDGKLMPDERRAPIVREIFRQYESGESIRSITLWLRGSEAQTWSGNKWGHSSVRRILTNETYAGTAYYGTHRREGNVLRQRAPSERIVLSVPPLIDRAQWERVQAKIAENPSVGRPSVYYLLRGLLQCSCGRRMSGNTRRKYRSYRCSGRDALRHLGTRCRCAVAATRIDQAVWSTLVKTFTDPKFLSRVLSENERRLRGDGQRGLATLQEQARKLKRKENRVLELMMDEELADDRARLKKRYLELGAERFRIESQITAANGVRTATTSAEWLECTMDLLRKYIPTLTEPEQRQKFVQGCVTQARWNGIDTVEVDCFLGSELITTSS